MADAAERWTRIQTLFEQARERPHDERTAWLRAACGDDPEVYRHVAAMLEGADHEHDLFGGRALDLVSSEALDAGLLPSREGERVGPWVLGERIGAGGMGAVYRAERAAAPGGFEQTAALKRVKPGMDSGAVLARFQAERQILARLQHAGIARLLDGGLGPDERPYFAMELVEGEPITDHCDARRLGTAARLGLFAEVAEAVAYAHRNLVVHRDLKPSNILVTADGRVKLLDFGIARVLSDDGMDLTRTGQRVLTPSYAAPEQVRGEAPTTATDVFALGGLLYRLLSGTRPVETEGRTPAEVERAVLEEVPPPPSAAVTPEAARQRRTTAGALAKRLRGDLDVICQKALRKEPERRYGSAAELLADVRRHLDGEPIEARSPTTRYRVRKFVGRHRVGVAAAAVALAAVVGGAGLALWQAAEARAQRDRAETEAATAEAVTEFIASLLWSASPTDPLNPNAVNARDVRVVDLLAQGTERIEAELADQPEVQIRLYDVVGEAHRALGDYAAAADALERAYALIDADGVRPDTRAMVAHNLASLRQEAGDLHASESLLREALGHLRSSPDPTPGSVGVVLNQLGYVLSDKGEHAEAEPILREAVEAARRHYGPGHPYVDVIAVTHARTRYALGDADAYERTLREVLSHIRRRGPADATAASTIGTLGNFLVEERGDPEAGEPLIREALEIRRRTLGEDHPFVAVSLNELAGARLALGDVAGATALFERALALRRRVHGGGHPYIAYSLVGLARARQAAGRADEAAPLFREALEIRRAALPEGHELIAETEALLGAALEG